MTAWFWMLSAAASDVGFVEGDDAVLWRVEGEGSFGWAVSELADINGDGAMEVIAGAPYADSSAGACVVLSGATGEELYRFAGESGSQLGFAIADAGDVDGDGVHDILCGAPGSGAGEGRVYSGADGSLIHALPGDEDGEKSGFAVSSGGDLDGDGRSEVVVTAAAWDSATGRAYVYRGADGTRLHTLSAQAEGERMGSAAGLAGDVSGDGIPDLILGARDAGADQGGRVYVFSGADGSVLLGPLGEGIETLVDLGYFFVGGVGDISGDGVPDIYGGDFSSRGSGGGSGSAYVFSGADGSVLLTLHGDEAGEGLGCGRGAGDMDGDGVPDLAVGSWGDDSVATNAGRVSVFSGVDGAVLYRFTNQTAQENFGFDTVGVGDVNGDGAGDLVASAATANWVVMLAGTPTVAVDTADEADTSEPVASQEGCGCGGSAAGVLVPLLLWGLSRGSTGAAGGPGRGSRRAAERSGLHG